MIFVQLNDVRSSYKEKWFLTCKELYSVQLLYACQTFLGDS